MCQMLCVQAGGHAHLWGITPCIPKAQDVDEEASLPVPSGYCDEDASADPAATPEQESVGSNGGAGPPQVQRLHPFVAACTDPAADVAVGGCGHFCVKCTQFPPFSSVKEAAEGGQGCILPLTNVWHGSKCLMK